MLLLSTLWCFPPQSMLSEGAGYSHALAALHDEGYVHPSPHLSSAPSAFAPARLREGCACTHRNTLTYCLFQALLFLSWLFSSMHKAPFLRKKAKTCKRKSLQSQGSGLTCVNTWFSSNIFLLLFLRNHILLDMGKLRHRRGKGWSNSCLGGLHWALPLAHLHAGKPPIQVWVTVFKICPLQTHQCCYKPLWRWALSLGPSRPSQGNNHRSS